MSQMQSLTNGPLGDKNQDEVYVIFRVYNLGKANTALMVYVDPEEHRRAGRLLFKSDKWTVVPA